MYNENKLDYLAKTLSRTKRKDYENYVINAVWNRINNKNLYPVSQQYVKKDDGSYYLIDLYFPQLNIGIEVDEPYHENQQDEDLIREMDIFDVLSLINENSYTSIHIKVSEKFDEVEKQIDDAVVRIKEEINRYENERPLVFSGKDVKDYTNASFISIDDLASFSTIVEIANTVLGKNYKAQQHASFKIQANYMAWFPKLDVNSENNRGWENTITADGMQIYEKSEKNKNIELDVGTTRVVFAQTKNITGKRVYRFVGVFKQKTKMEDDTFVYERIATEFKVIH